MCSESPANATVFKGTVAAYVMTGFYQSTRSDRGRTALFDTPRISWPDGHHSIVLISGARAGLRSGREPITLRHVYTTNLTRPMFGQLAATAVITAVADAHTPLLLPVVQVLTKSTSLSEEEQRWGLRATQLPTGSQAAPRAPASPCSQSGAGSQLPGLIGILCPG